MNPFIALQILIPDDLLATTIDSDAMDNIIADQVSLFECELMNLIDKRVRVQESGNLKPNGR